jgi:hypothetical protein
MHDIMLRVCPDHACLSLGQEACSVHNNLRQSVMLRTLGSPWSSGQRPCTCYKSSHLWRGLRLSAWSHSLTDEVSWEGLLRWGGGRFIQSKSVFFLNWGIGDPLLTSLTHPSERASSLTRHPSLCILGEFLYSGFRLECTWQRLPVLSVPVRHS